MLKGQIGLQKQDGQDKNNNAVPKEGINNSSVPYPNPNPHCVFDLATTFVGNDGILVRSNRTGKSEILASGEASFLLSCQKFEPLPAHAERYARRLK